MVDIVINPDKTISVNGKKTFPQIFYAICSSNTDAATCQSNLRSNNVYDASIDNEYKDIHAQEGVPYISHAYTMADKTNPAYFGYYQKDEPISNGIDLNLLKDVYGRIKAYDPDHVVLVVDFTNLMAMKDIADIIGMSCYAYKTQTIPLAGTRANIPYYWEYALKGPWCNALSGVSDFDSIPRPVYPVISAIGAAQDEAGVLKITPTELRVWVYSAITMNMKGLIYYAYSWTPGDDGLDNDPVLAQAYRNQAAEIKSLNDILVLPTKDYRWQYRQGTQVKFSNVLTGWNGFTNFNYILKQSESTTYLIVVNKDSRPISDVTITISGLTGTTTATTLGTVAAGSVPGIQKSVVNGSWVDSFTGYEVKILEIPIIPPEPVPVMIRQEGEGSCEFQNRTQNIVEEFQYDRSFSIMSNDVIRITPLPALGWRLKHIRWSDSSEVVSTGPWEGPVGLPIDWTIVYEEIPPPPYSGDPRLRAIGMIAALALGFGLLRTVIKR